MSVDRYEYVARILKYFGWFHDIMLRNVRRQVVDIFRARGVTSVLDACCGAGTLSRYLRDSGMTVTGVDASASMLALARKKAIDIRFIEADLTDFTINETVDGAVVALALHEMDEQARSKVWESLRRETKVGGPLIVLDFAISDKGGILSKITWKFIWGDERHIGKHDSSHFENFKDFMELGGMRQWLVNRGEMIFQERYFLWGNLGVFVVNA